MSNDKKLNSVFHQMYRGERKHEGSFYTGLYNLFLIADMGNKNKLVKAFPDFFGSEVPEFGININKLKPSEQLIVLFQDLIDTEIANSSGNISHNIKDNIVRFWHDREPFNQFNIEDLMIDYKL